MGTSAPSPDRGEFHHVESMRPRTEVTAAEVHHRPMDGIEGTESLIDDSRRNAHSSTLVTTLGEMNARQREDAR